MDGYARPRFRCERPEPAHRHRRRRVRRHRGGGVAPPGRIRRHHGAGEGRSGRRCVAGQHLSGLRLRHSGAALLVLVRAEPGLVTALPATVGDPCLPGTLRRGLRSHRRDPVRRRRHRSAVGRVALADHVRGRHVDGRRHADPGDGSAVAPGRPRPARCRHVHRAAPAHGPLGSRTRRRGSPRRRHRHRCERDPARTGDCRHAPRT